MAKSQKRNSREPKKEKTPENKAKKATGPKYLRAEESLQAGRLGEHRQVKK